ncbi:MAG: hypothetical protein DMG76_32460 [Acidobacteria bacterium]|nr:MAG: hypothetical protein DMG76_32460 [Acidobacteriota bacterium]
MVELPTDAEKPTHTRPSGIRSSKPLVPPVELLPPPAVPNWPFFLSFFLSFFLFAPLFFLCAYRQLSTKKFRAWIA